MNKILQAASVIALSVAASSAAAWYAAPYPGVAFAPNLTPNLTEEQKQAIADQQKAMVAKQQEMAAQYAKAAQAAMAARQEMVRKAVEQQASYLAELKDQLPGVPAVMDPLVGNPFDPMMAGPMGALPGIPAMPEPPTFDYPDFPDLALPEIPGIPPMPSFRAPALPEMPALPERPALPEFAAPEMPALPEIPGFEAPAMPELPAYGRPSAPDLSARLKEVESYRTKAKQQANARRAALRDMNERRHLVRPYYRPYGPRHFGYMPAWGPMMGPGMGRPGMELAPPAPSTAEQAAAPAAEAQAIEQ